MFFPVPQNTLWAGLAGRAPSACGSIFARGNKLSESWIRLLCGRSAIPVYTLGQKNVLATQNLYE